MNTITNHGEVGKAGRRREENGQQLARGKVDHVRGERVFITTIHTGAGLDIGERI